MSFTGAQQKAISARGNVLVVAGAGTGKTRTLVERCLHCLLEEKPPLSLDELLVVTFTDAAATEIRQRIRARLEEQLEQHVDKHRWLEQLALFDNAHIGTLHSFCLQLIRQHFYELELDPQLTVMPEEEARLLAEETLEEILQRHYAGKDSAAEAVQQLIQTHGHGTDQAVRALVLKLHNYTQTLRDPRAWLDSQSALFQSPEPTQWRAWLVEGIQGWCNRWLPILRNQSPDNLKAIESAALLEKIPASVNPGDYSALLQEIENIDCEWPRGKKTAWRAAIAGFFDEALFLSSLITTGSAPDPLAEDWNWVRGQMSILLELTREFTAAFSDKKRELGAVDFHDLEQHSLRLLWDRDTKQPTAIARHWRLQLRFVFVDEYQDINEAQDAILKALSREGEAANRFLVGDVKQSIYRFRLAAPRIFQDYAGTWQGDSGQVIPLSDNFRSREAILGFVNALFAAAMRPEIGGVAYDENARLLFGDPKNRKSLALAHDSAPRVELHLRLKGTVEPSEGEDESTPPPNAANVEESGKEARLAALRLRELKSSQHLIWDEPSKRLRPVDWGDMAILLRSPSGKTESYTKEFARLGIPLTVNRSGFYDSMEIADLISLLQLLDNPLQDLPALAVLHSPLAGMSPDELAAIRLVARRERFWTALSRFHESHKEHSTRPKADRFLQNFARWRRLARQVSLSRCLETVLSETHYAAWLLTQPRGEQRHANVQRLLALARQFDQFQRQGLFRFLHFVDAQKAAETEPDVAPVSGGNSVSLMSIHQSKGLEFPVVVLADLGKQFNFSDLSAEIILDEKFGLCPLIKPPHIGRRYPSLPHWLAQRRQKEETLGEELRLLYVAMTRARDTLILTGSLSAKKFANQWQSESNAAVVSMAARNYLDWLAAWTSNSPELLITPPNGANHLLNWTIYDSGDARLLEDIPQPVSETDSAEAATPAPTKADSLQQRLAWKYPRADATNELAKTTVTALRRRLAEEADDEAVPLFKFQTRTSLPLASGKLSAADIGLAHHTFLQSVSLEKTGSVDELKHEARRLENESLLTADESAQIDLAAIAAFWQSDLGKKIRAQSEHVRRELEFTARFSPEELHGLTNPAPELFNEDFVVVQGAADLVVLLPQEIWIVDFKTDSFKPPELPEKIKLYEPQLRHYAKALSRIYGRPVTQLHLHFLKLRQSASLQPK